MILGPQGPGKVGQRGGFPFSFTPHRKRTQQRHNVDGSAARVEAGVAQLVEHYLAKVDVASSNLVSRSKFNAPTST